MATLQEANPSQTCLKGGSPGGCCGVELHIQPHHPTFHAIELFKGIPLPFYQILPMLILDILPEVFMGYAATLLDLFFGFLQDVLKSR